MNRLIKREKVMHRTQELLREAKEHLHTLAYSPGYGYELYHPNPKMLAMEKQIMRMKLDIYRMAAGIDDEAQDRSQ